MKLRTRLPVDECMTRLASAVDAERLGFSRSGYGGSKPILGKLRGATFRLQVRRNYRNSFAPFFFGRLVASEGGTVVEGAFRLHPFVRAFVICWFSFLAVFMVVALAVPSRGEPEALWVRMALVLCAVVMGIFGVGLVKFGGWLAREEPGAIVALLRETLEAEEFS